MKKETFLEITKLSKKEWEILKNTVDYLFEVESKEREKQLYLDSTKLETRLRTAPNPIRLLFE